MAIKRFQLKYNINHDKICNYYKMSELGANLAEWACIS